MFLNRSSNSITGIKWVDVFVSVDEIRKFSSPRSFSDFEKRVGKTPIFELKRINNTKSRIFVKADFLNPSGSIKDVMAYHMIKRAEERGVLHRGMEIIEATSGNTGISLALISKLRGYNFTAVMPEHMSIERRKIIESLGGKIVLTPEKEDMGGAVKKLNEISKERPGAWLPKQFENPDNIEAHKNITWNEIHKYMNGKIIDAFVAGVGTGGTIMGVAECLKQHHQHARIVAVEPDESPVMSGGRPGIHGIQGIGEGFVPKLVDMKMIDEIVRIKTKDAIEMTNRLLGEENLFAGISSGANVLASLKMAKKIGEGKNIVTVLPDSGNRYLSMGIFNLGSKNKE